MLTIEQALLQYNSRLTNEILANPDFRSATASGNFANFVNTAQSIELKSTPERVEFTKYGTSYTTALDKGTPPGQAQGLAKDIYEWLAYKKYGLDWRNEKQRKNLADYLAYKIQRFGSYKHRETGAQTAIIAEALEKSEPTLMEGLNTAIFGAIDTQIKKMTDDGKG